MDKSAKLIGIIILGGFGAFMAWTCATWLFDYQGCMANSTCAQYGPDSKSNAWQNLLFGVWLLWGAWITIRPGGRRSRLLIIPSMLLCLAYIVPTVLALNGIIAPFWSMQNAILNIALAGVGLIALIRAYRKPIRR